MNINNFKFSPVRLNDAQQNNQKKHRSIDFASDSFERTSEIAFKGAKDKILQTTAKTLQDSAKEILGNSDLLAKFGAFAAAAFAGLATLASGRKDETTQIAETLVDAFSKTEENNEQTQEVVNDIEEDDIRIITPEYSTVAETSQEENTQADNSAELVQARFPKKHGKFSKEQLVLKEMVESYRLREEQVNKLYEICDEIIKSKEASIDKYGFNTEYLLTELPMHSETLEDCETFINKLHERYKKLLAEVKAEPVDNSKTLVEKPEVKTEEIYITDGEREVKPGIKVVGKVDISGYKPYRKTEKTNNATPSKTESQKVENKEKIARTRINVNEEELVLETKLDSIDSKNMSYNFRIPGTLNPVYAKKYLTKVMTNFESTFEEKFYPSIVQEQRENGIKEEDIPKSPKWLTSKPIPDVDLEYYIRKEITDRNKDVSSYTNISTDDAEYLADLIEYEPRFRKFFTLHAALRFIDRVVDFSSQEDPSVQIEEKLDLFFSALTKALSQNIKIDSYSQKDFKDESKIYYGTRIILEPDEKNNPELYDFAGSFPLIIGLSENQPRSDYYDFKNKTPLIHTIFFQGL